MAGIECDASDDATTCTLTEFEPAITIPLAAGWMAYPSSPNWVDEAAQLGRSDSETAFLAFTMTDEVYDYADADSLPTAVDAPSDVAGMVDHLTALPGLRTSGPVDTTIAGREAVQVEGEVVDAPTAVASEPDSCPMGPRADELLLYAIGDCPEGAVPGEDHDVYWLGEGTHVRLTVVDVGGQVPLLITVEDAADTFPDTLAQADEMLADLEFGGQ